MSLTARKTIFFYTFIIDYWDYWSYWNSNITVTLLWTSQIKNISYWWYTLHNAQALRALYVNISSITYIALLVEKKRILGGRFFVVLFVFYLRLDKNVLLLGFLSRIHWDGKTIWPTKYRIALPKYIVVSVSDRKCKMKATTDCMGTANIINDLDLNKI